MEAPHANRVAWQPNTRPVPPLLARVLIANATLHPTWSAARVVDDTLSRIHHANGGDARPKRGRSVVGVGFVG